MDAVSRTLDHERIANESKHWVRLTAACNSRCIFCLDSEAQDGRILAWDDVCREILRGREEKDATRIVLSGGEASLHPRFHDFIRFSRDAGYTWIQTVTNGRFFARRDFFLNAVDAGLSEITFSLHGHNAQLHDDLTRSPGSFEQIIKAIMRAVRDGRVIVNADVVINKQNVAYLERIIALLTQLGVREYDLLHVIPQGEAWEYRDQLFYNVDDWSESLRRVFRLGLNPNFHVWTNRFPVAHLEGMEELIQDPHKMLDEVGGRRVQFRKYLDEGTPIDCRHPERCPHCFIEPFCSSLDRKIQAMQRQEQEVWWVGDRMDLAQIAIRDGLPNGCHYLGMSVPPPSTALPLYLKLETYPELPTGSRGVARTPAQALQLDGREAELWLDKELCAFLLENTPLLHRNVENWVLHGPTWLHMQDSVAHSPDYPAFFRQLPFQVRSQNLPPCLCPNTRMERPLKMLDAGQLHDQGNLAIDPIVEQYIAEDYRAKSLRCRGCPANERCSGGHLQHLRHAGFRILQPLSGPWAEEATARLAGLYPEKPGRLAQGLPPQVPPPRVPVAGNAPVPEIDTAPGRRS